MNLPDAAIRSEPPASAEPPHADAAGADAFEDAWVDGVGGVYAVDVQRPGLVHRIRELSESMRQAFVARAALPLWYFSGRRSTGSVGVLMYHRTASVPRRIPAPTFNVTPERLRGQLSGLLKRGYRAWPLRDVIAALDAGRCIPPKVFVVTFDDGHASNYTEAWPVLTDLKVPATIFVATAYLDSPAPFPFDDWRLSGHASCPPSSWRPLTTTQCERMLAGGLIDLGSHTHTHQDFRGRPRAFERDVRNSVEVLRQRFGIESATFAFPWGRRNRGFAGKPLSDAARQSGVLCALTTESELVQPSDDRFDWGRFTAAQTDTAATLAAKIDGSYTRTRNLWREAVRPAAGRRRQSSVCRVDPGQPRGGSGRRHEAP